MSALPILSQGLRSGAPHRHRCCTQQGDRRRWRSHRCPAIIDRPSGLDCGDHPNDGVCESGTTGHTPVLHLANLHEQPEAPILHACPSLAAPDYAPRESGGMPPSDRSSSVEEVRQTLAGWSRPSGRPHRTPHHGRGQLPEPPCRASRSKIKAERRLDHPRLHRSALRSGRIAAEAVIQDAEAKSPARLRNIGKE